MYRCHCLLHEFHTAIFLCVTLKLFSLSFVHLLAPSPGDAAGRGQLSRRRDDEVGSIKVST